MVYVVTRVYTGEPARYTKGVLTIAVRSLFENGATADFEEGEASAKRGMEQVHYRDCADQCEDFFSNVVPIALQGFKRLRMGSEAKRNGPGEWKRNGVPWYGATFAVGFSRSGIVG
jgi:hypothetical protein